MLPFGFIKMNRVQKKVYAIMVKYRDALELEAEMKNPELAHLAHQNDFDLDKIKTKLDYIHGTENNGEWNKILKGGLPSKLPAKVTTGPHLKEEEKMATQTGAKQTHQQA